MYRVALAAALAAVPILLVACDDASPPTAPEASAARATAEAGRPVTIMDACDPASFDAVLGPGACTRPGGVLFARFIDLLGKHGSVGAWHFAPSTFNARVGDALLATNHGGEVHTFTEVEEFGGGMVPLLNELSGNPVPAPECLALADEDMIPPGGTYADEVEEAGAEQYQCCIHPWMRLTLSARP